MSTPPEIHFDIVSEIRGLGLMIGIEFSDSDSYISTEIVQKIRSTCLSHNLLLVSCGPKGNVIRLMPPLTITQPELLDGLRILIDTCQQL